MKRFVSMALAICLLCTAFALPASALTAADFTDIPNNWAKSAIEYCLQKGLMKGEGSGKFNPGGQVTRAQIAQVLYNREGSPSIEGLENPFTDVGAQWFANAVIWCKNNGVVNGNSATTFNPTGQVTRQDICVMVYRYVKDYKKLAAELTEESKMSDTYTDWGKVAGYAKEPIRWANKVGFMSGTSATTLDPKGKATRAQLAQFLKNLDKVLENEKPGPTPSPEPEKCEHGNDPDTCPICHPDKPQYTGSYRENVPFEETTTVSGLTGPLGAFLPQSDDPSGDAMFQKNNVSKCTQEISDKVRRNLDNACTSGDPRFVAYYNSQADIIPEGHSYRNFVPYGGSVVNGTTYTVDIGGHTYTKAQPDGNGEMKIYNRFGVDVTSVDGVMTDTERKMMVLLQDSGYWRYDFHAKTYGDLPTLVYDPCLQMVAEAALQEAIENADNLAKAGLNPAQCYGGRVIASRNALEASKKYDLSNSKLAHKLFPSTTGGFGSTQMVMSFEEFMSSGTYALYKDMGIADLPEDAIRLMWGDDYDYEYAHHSKECKNSSIDYNTSSDLYDGIAMEYFGGWQVNSQYNAVHGSTHPYCFEDFNMKGISVRSSLSGIDYSTCVALCQVPETHFSVILLGSHPAIYSWNDDVRECGDTSMGGGISRVGIAYDEDVNQWCIVVSGSYKHSNYVTGKPNGSAGGAFGHDTTDPNSNMAWWDQFVTSEATEW